MVGIESEYLEDILGRKGMGCLFSGSLYFSERSPATIKMGFLCILCATHVFSTSFLFGWFLSCRMPGG